MGRCASTFLTGNCSMSHLSSRAPFALKTNAGEADQFGKLGKVGKEYDQQNSDGSGNYIDSWFHTRKANVWVWVYL